MEYFLSECNGALKEALIANKDALNQFLFLDFFRQRSLSNYVNHAENESEKSQRVNEVLANLLEKSTFSPI